MVILVFLATCFLLALWTSLSIDPPTSASYDNDNENDKETHNHRDQDKALQGDAARRGNDGRVGTPPPQKMQFAKDIPIGILSQKPTSFFRELQRQIDDDDVARRCERYGYRPNNHLHNENNNEPEAGGGATTKRRRLFHGSLIAEEPWELIEIVATEAYGIYTGMVFVESNRTQNFDPRPIRRANDPKQIAKLRDLFLGRGSGSNATTDDDNNNIDETNNINSYFDVRFYSNENPKFTGLRREHDQRQEILRGWKAMGMLPEDVGIIADADETFTRDFLRTIQECDIPNLDYNLHRCYTSKVKLAASSRVFETSPDCVTATRGWYHPELVLGACIEMIGNSSIHPIAVRDGPRRAHGYGRGCSHDFSKIEQQQQVGNNQSYHPLWNAADFRMLCGQQAFLVGDAGAGAGAGETTMITSNYTGFHFHNFFTNFNATRMKYFTYGHAMKARKAFATSLEEIGKNDLKLLYRCSRNIPDDNDQKWKRIVGGLDASPPPIPIYFMDAEYRRKRHEWVQAQVQSDDRMVASLQQSQYY